MPENEKPLLEIGLDARDKVLVSAGITPCARHSNSPTQRKMMAALTEAVAAEAIHRWQESDKGKAWRDGAVAEWLKSLPPGDDAAAIAGRAAYYATFGQPVSIAWDRLVAETKQAERAYVAAVLEVHRKQLGSPLLPADEELAQAFLKARYNAIPAMDRLPGDKMIPWSEYGDTPRKAILAGIAAVLDRFPPGKLGEAETHARSLCAAVETAPLKERIKSLEQNLEHEADAYTRNLANNGEAYAVETNRLRTTMRNAAHKLLRAVGDEPTGE